MINKNGRKGMTSKPKSGHDDLFKNLSQYDYDKLMADFNKQLDQLWAEIEQSEIYAEYLNETHRNEL